MLKKLLAVGIAVVGANWLVYGEGLPLEGSLGTVLFILIANLCVHIAFFSREKTSQQQLSRIVSGVAIASAVLSMFRASTFDTFWLTVQSYVLSALALYLAALTAKEFGSVVELVAFPFRLFTAWIDAAGHVLHHELSTVLKAVSSRASVLPKKSSVRQDTVAALLRGIAITIPVVLVVVSLLAQADPIFSKTIEQLFQLPTISISIPTRIVFSVVVAALMLPVAFLRIQRAFHSPLQRSEYKKFGLEFSMLAGAVASVLALFLIIQFRYLFLAVPDQSLLAFGMATYSDYVRKGFGELMVVAVIVYSVVAASYIVFRQMGAGGSTLRRINLVLLSEMGIYILSILRRVMLYQAEHGLTRVRVYGTLFLFMLLALTAVLLLRYLKGKNYHWHRIEAGIVMGAILLSGMLNVDHLIATLWKPTVNKEVDYMYISRLSADASDGWLQAVEHIKKQPASTWLTQTSYTTEEARQIVYNYKTLTELIDTYAILAWDYGTKEDQLVFHPDYTRPTSYRRYNVAKATAYRKLHSQVPPAMMQEYVSIYRQLYAQLSSEQKNMMYDRSYESPLTR